MRYCLTIFLLMAGPVLAAEPAASITVDGETELGRVFMSRADRQILDRLRKSPPLRAEENQDPGTSATVSSDPRDRKKVPAGYIVPANGVPYKWVDGDFRKTTHDDIESEALPGRISIIRRNSMSTTGSQSDSASGQDDVLPVADSVSVAENAHEKGN